MSLFSVTACGGSNLAKKNFQSGTHQRQHRVCPILFAVTVHGGSNLAKNSFTSAIDYANVLGYVPYYMQ
jgi:hypothetical protein